MPQYIIILIIHKNIYAQEKISQSPKPPTRAPYVAQEPLFDDRPTDPPTRPEIFSFSISIFHKKIFGRAKIFAISKTADTRVVRRSGTPLRRPTRRPADPTRDFFLLHFHFPQKNFRPSKNFRNLPNRRHGSRASLSNPSSTTDPTIPSGRPAIFFSLENWNFRTKPSNSRSASNLTPESPGRRGGRSEVVPRV
jgi:hypothetical protein